jgi:hypothetical protein
MELTKSKLKQIIKEEAQKIYENDPDISSGSPADQIWEQVKQETIKKLLDNDQKGPGEGHEIPVAIITRAIWNSSQIQDDEDITAFVEEVAKEFTSHPLNQDPHGAESTLDPQETIEEVFYELGKQSREDYESQREDEATSPWQENTNIKLTQSQLKQIIQEELQNILKEKDMMCEKKGAPYRGIRRRGRTESQKQQKAAGMAWGCRKKRGEERKKCAKKLKDYGGAAGDLYDGEITNDELRKLATIRGGAEIPEKDAKPGKKRKALPKKIEKK